MFNPQDFIFPLFNDATQEGGDITLKIILIPQVLLPRFLIRYCLIPYYPLLITNKNTAKINKDDNFDKEPSRRSGMYQDNKGFRAASTNNEINSKKNTKPICVFQLSLGGNTM